ncbi:MAG: hypothetical protein ACTSRL_19900, partial [Candidatus Helarchaeota archaeon]
SWYIDPQTRIITNVEDGEVGSGNHTPIWIFADVSLGDTVPIGMFGEKEHLFNVSGELLYDLPGFGPVEVWVLEDLTIPGGFAWYEKSTGILLKGLFYFGGGDFFFSLDFLNTNAEFICLPNDHRPTLTSGLVTPLTGNPSTNFTFTVTYSDQDNNPPAYINVVINGTSYPMVKQTPSDKNYVDGAIYQYRTTLGPGTYSYSFECSDWKALISTDAYFDLVVIEPTNGAATQVRETLTFTLYPELLWSTPTLFHAFGNGTTIFMPTERLTMTYDLATGIILRLLLEHIADPTDPEDTNLTHLDMVLVDTNLLQPYEFQFHGQTLPIFVPPDAAIKSFFTTYEITFEELQNFVFQKIDYLKEEIQESPDEYWRNPASERKAAMNHKLNALKDLISSYTFECAYNKLLHDIKPKLTGLKTDENEVVWGNGVFHNPWVTYSDLQEAFREKCNEILFLLAVLMNYKPDTGISL